MLEVFNFLGPFLVAVNSSKCVLFINGNNQLFQLKNEMSLRCVIPHDFSFGLSLFVFFSVFFLLAGP